MFDDIFEGIEWWEQEHSPLTIRNMTVKCALWRKEIFEHYTGLEAYADAGIEEMERFLHGT